MLIQSVWHTVVDLVLSANVSRVFLNPQTLFHTHFSHAARWPGLTAQHQAQTVREKKHGKGRVLEMLAGRTLRQRPRRRACTGSTCSACPAPPPGRPADPAPATPATPNRAAGKLASLSPWQSTHRPQPLLLMVCGAGLRTQQQRPQRCCHERIRCYPQCPRRACGARASAHLAVPGRALRVLAGVQRDVGLCTLG